MHTKQRRPLHLAFLLCVLSSLLLSAGGPTRESVNTLTRMHQSNSLKCVTLKRDTVALFEQINNAQLEVVATYNTRSCNTCIKQLLMLVYDSLMVKEGTVREDISVTVLAHGYNRSLKRRGAIEQIRELGLPFQPRVVFDLNTAPPGGAARETPASAAIKNPDMQAAIHDVVAGGITPALITYTHTCPEGRKVWTYKSIFDNAGTLKHSFIEGFSAFVKGPCE